MGPAFASFWSLGNRQGLRDGSCLLGLGRLDGFGLLSLGRLLLLALGGLGGGSSLRLGGGSGGLGLNPKLLLGLLLGLLSLGLLGRLGRLRLLLWLCLHRFRRGGRREIKAAQVEVVPARGNPRRGGERLADGGERDECRGAADGEGRNNGSGLELHGTVSGSRWIRNGGILS